LHPCRLALLALTLLAVPSAPGALISLVGNSPNANIAGISSSGVPLVGAYADPYHTNDASVPSSFSNNFLVINNETKSSAPIAFSTVPYVTGLLGELYFVFVLDSQETQQGVSLQFDTITLTVGGLNVWTMTDSLRINDTTVLADQTRTPLGNGADLALMIPVWFFNNLGLTGNSTFLFTATETLGHNGNDEWKLIGANYAGTAFFQPNTPINSSVPAPVPEPSTLLPLVAAAGWLWRHPRNTRPN
jgi:hypothetical protein